MAILSLNCCDLGQFWAVAGAGPALPDGRWQTGRLLNLKEYTFAKLKRYDQPEPVLLDAHGVS
jgi:hypothetical protein